MEIGLDVHCSSRFNNLVFIGSPSFLYQFFHSLAGVPSSLENLPPRPGLRFTPGGTQIKTSTVKQHRRACDQSQGSPLQGQILFISSGFSSFYGDCIVVDKTLRTLFFYLTILDDTHRLLHSKNEYVITYDSTLNLKYLPCVYVHIWFCYWLHVILNDPLKLLFLNKSTLDSVY